MTASLSKISILIPTLNAARVLEKCLKSIASQDYPKKKMEIIIADGGSVDKTLAIAKKYKAKIYKNPLKTGEVGKAVALREAQGELVALVDSDDVLPNKSWLKRMVEPFSDKEILGAEPWEFTYRRKDSLVNRYCALIGANDPYCYFIGNYDKRSVLSGKWTGLNLDWKDKGQYLRVKIEKGLLPTIGANGTIWRTEVLKGAIGRSDYLFDTDIPYLLAKEKSFWFAKVKIGIIHLYCHSVKDFYRKQKRRAKDFFYLESKKERSKTYQRQRNRQLYFIVSAMTILPLVVQTARGYLKKRDRAWFFHPIACWLTLWLYSSETIFSYSKKSQMKRGDWKQ